MTESSNKLDRLIAKYLQEVEAGQQPNRDELVAANPDVAHDLHSFFINHDAMRGHEDATIPPSEPSSEQPTIVPNPHDDKTIPPYDSNSDTQPVTTGDGDAIRYFGDHELIEEVARGGMGVVYKAKQTKLNRIVALKMILAGQLASEDDVKRFHTEAEAAANLDHPGIVPIYEIGEQEGQHYFSMGFVEGESLADRIEDGPLPPREAAEITKKVAEAIAYAHERGVIHRDLKPGNILMDSNGEPRVTDFGLAKRVEGDSDLTATGQILGTPSYMPPEQASGKIDEIDERADVYSLGAVLYALLTGRPPFQADTALDTILQVIERDPTPVQELNSSVNSDLCTICSKCLLKNPEHRYESADSLIDDLNRYARNEPINARPVSAIVLLWRWYRHLRGNKVVRLKSASSLFGWPLVNIAIGPDTQTGEVVGLAKGIIAIGNHSTGVIAIGDRAFGIIVIGGRALGVISFGGIAAGCVAIGSCSVGLVSIGAFSAGLFSIGAVSVGYGAIGLLAIGRYVFGGFGYGQHVIAIGKKSPESAAFFEKCGETIIDCVTW